MTLGVTLTPVLNARVDPEDARAETQALHVFGVPIGACPPGTRRATSVGWIANEPPPPRRRRRRRRRPRRRRRRARPTTPSCTSSRR